MRRPPEATAVLARMDWLLVMSLRPMVSPWHYWYNFKTMKKGRGKTIMTRWPDMKDISEGNSSWNKKDFIRAARKAQEAQKREEAWILKNLLS